MKTNTKLGLASESNQKRGLASERNTKLDQLKAKACAWCWSSTFEDGSEDEEKRWLDECDTMIVGLALASAQGQGSDMFVGATLYLDVKDGGQQCCFEGHRLRKKSATIDSKVVQKIFKNLMEQYIWHHEKKEVPVRILVIRSGGHDGIFSDIRDHEIGGIREAFFELRCEKDGVRVTEGDGSCPLITYLVAQDSHNIRLAPAKPNEFQSLARNTPVNCINVPCGTCIDSPELLLPKDDSESEGVGLFVEKKNTNQDFFLIPHGGLKGTSRGTHYRCILNENFDVYRKNKNMNSEQFCLTPKRLQRLIFVLSFIYGKATKAPKDCALVKTSSLLAGILLGSSSTINHEEMIEIFQNHESHGLNSEKSNFEEPRESDSLISSFGRYRADNELGSPFRPHLVA